ncbi:MAG TPA: hypothetical protein DCL80_09550 [Balneola sp.]|jgi:hypothetical protein|nr:hypothetical protein [Balneola sp.]MAO77097.1 hypothetical protein [Balneola sp.]MBF64664.1 hypothetical protein [Balneola sp.]MBF65916.1 hypothetical protein [Balneola sp.]HAH51483.1 hypothetical protein [Balneola sp.]|tara:strand:+ start:17155 stop:17994 length:840 start_codon:yes stop_codon:yes gene_type:complete
MVYEKKREKILITVKTYPTLSGKYDELVCTAGFREDGSWVRIYPIPFRKKSYEEQYSKYDWIEIELTKNTSDFRPESYRPYSHDTEIKIIGNISTGKKRDWAVRKEIVLQKVYDDLSILVEEAKDKKTCTSLAVFKPTKILDFFCEEVEREWDKKKIERLKANRDQGRLFENHEDPFEVVNKLPYKFKYRFEDCKGKQSNMMIEDWEIGQLYWNSLKRHEGDEGLAIEDVRKKYLDDFAKTKDLYFYLGTTQVHHFVGQNPFVIIGTFHPPKTDQISLF